jgi:predicted MPP superfamily phosphohydrolase
MLLRWFLLIGFVFLIEFYSFQAFKTVIKPKVFHWIYLLVSVLALVLIVYGFTKFDRSVGQTKQSLFTIGLLLLFIIPKVLITSILLLEDITRVLLGIVRVFTDNTSSSENFLPERRKFISQVALGLAAIPFSSLIYGMTLGKYNFKVIRQQLSFPDLPEAFDGFIITHISDIHSGSFDNKEKIEYAIDLINQQETDIILFTGDIVNSLATEMHPWIDTFKKINTPKHGKYSVLGNHDYGEYIDWKGDNKAKEKNFEDIKDLHRQIDFKLLLNEHVFIEKNNQKMVLVGVENWGEKFKKAGDLNKASQGLTKDDFKILMSHDPSHWNSEVQYHKKHFQLTLSGHTHGFQFGIEIPGIIKWSPVQYVYKQWAGLYENLERKIYVNRGFGFHAYPGRVGIMPEITIIELKKS